MPNPLLCILPEIQQYRPETLKSFEHGEKTSSYFAIPKASCPINHISVNCAFRIFYHLKYAVVLPSKQSDSFTSLKPLGSNSSHSQPSKNSQYVVLFNQSTRRRCHHTVLQNPGPHSELTFIKSELLCATASCCESEEIRHKLWSPL